MFQIVRNKLKSYLIYRLTMAFDLKTSRSLLNLLAHFDDTRMTFDEAMFCLQKCQAPFFIFQGDTEVLSRKHSFRVGQIRVVDAYKKGYILEFPFGVRKSITLVHEEERDDVELFVPFGHEPERVKRHHRDVCLRMDWEEQAKCVFFLHRMISLISDK